MAIHQRAGTSQAGSRAEASVITSITRSPGVGGRHWREDRLGPLMSGARNTEICSVKRSSEAVQ